MHGIESRVLEAAQGMRIGETCGHGVGYFKLQFGDSHLADDNPQASSVAVKVPLAVLPLNAILCCLLLQSGVLC